MAFTLGSSQGTLNGTTNVTVVEAPSSGVVRTVRLINIYNADTAAVTVYVVYKVSTSEYILCKVSVAAGETLLYDDPIVLDSTSKSIVARLGAAPASNNPHFVSAYGDQ